jgi:hypothetical protein
MDGVVAYKHLANHFDTGPHRLGHVRHHDNFGTSANYDGGDREPDIGGGGHRSHQRKVN